MSPDEIAEGMIVWPGHKDVRMTRYEDKKIRGHEDMRIRRYEDMQM